jgi:phage FluMu protein Com
MTTCQYLSCPKCKHVAEMDDIDWEPEGLTYAGDPNAHGPPDYYGRCSECGQLVREDDWDDADAPADDEEADT